MKNIKNNNYLLAAGGFFILYGIYSVITILLTGSPYASYLAGQEIARSESYLLIGIIVAFVVSTIFNIGSIVLGYYITKQNSWAIIIGIALSSLWVLKSGLSITLSTSLFADGAGLASLLFLIPLIPFTLLINGQLKEPKKIKGTKHFPK